MDLQKSFLFGVYFLEQEAKKRFLISLGYYLAVVLIILAVVKFLLSYFLPFIFAGIIAFAVQKPAAKLCKKIRFKRGTLAAILAAVLYLAAASLMIFLFYRLMISSRGLLDEIPSFFGPISDFIEKIRDKFSSIFLSFSPDLSEQIGMIVSELIEGLRHSLTSFLSSFATGFASKTPSFLFAGLVSLVASCYIAKDFEGLAKFFKSIIGNGKYETVIKVKSILSNSILKLLKGYLILTAITFIELFIGFLIIGVKHTFLFAFLIAFIDLLPVFGTGTALIPWGLISIILGNSFTGFSILFLYLFITVARNFLEPKIIGSQIGINPLFTLIAMFAGLRLYGFLGLVIFPVILIVVIKYYKNELEAEAEKNLSHNM